MNLRSVGALLAISTALSCATAIDNDVPPGPSQAAGSDSGGSAGLEEAGGESAGGAPQAGAPGGAGKGGAAKGGNGSAGAGKGGSGSGSGGRSGSGGTVGVAGASGSNSGGKAGTSSSGAGGGSAGSAGGGTTAGYCENPIDLPATAMNTGDIGKAAACFRTKAVFNAITCSSMEDRTVKVNGMLAKCSTVTAFPPAIDGWSYFDITAGAVVWAQVGWYKG